MRNHIVAVAALLSFVTWSAFTAYAEASQPAAKTAKSGGTGSAKPKPEELLRKMADYIGSLPAFSCHIDKTVELKAADIHKQFVTKMNVKFQKPNRIALVVEDGDAGTTVVSDGKQLTQYMPALNRYATVDAPATMAVFGKSEPFSPFTMMGVPPIPANDEEFKEIFSEVKKSEYLGTEKIGGVECHRLRFEKAKYDYDVWIATGDKPLLYKVAPDLSKKLANASDLPKGASINFQILIRDWNTAPKFADADFAFTPPSGAQKVDSLSDEEEESGPHPLIGQPAPTFKTEDVDGHPFDLASHLGKNVILLDFWATWCGPCVEAMPQIDAVAKKFAGKGLVFRAVNCGEDAKTIKEFLETSKLDPPVILDTKPEIGPLYKVNGIPQTVLIGKDGKVQVVHVGFAPALPELLTQEIEDLLAGKDLAGPQLKKADEAGKKDGAKQQESGASSTPPNDAAKAAEN
jgi:peroxiredoxin